MGDKEIENFIKKEKSLKKRIKYLLESENLSDFKCLVGADGPEQKAVPCHKFVFAITSYEFYNLFHNLSSNETVIKLPEICYKSFKQFIRYVYTEEITLNDKNIIEILVISRRFQIDHLRDFCFKELRKILQKNRDVEFIQQILKNSFIFRSVDICKFLLNDVIGINPLKYLNSTNVKVLRKTDLEIILKTSKSEVKETAYFQTAVLWAKTTISTKDLNEGVGTKLRNNLQDLVKLIRFPVMSCDEFHACLREYDGFLKTDEIFQIIFFITEKKGITSFPTEMRLGQIKSEPKVMESKPSGSSNPIKQEYKPQQQQQFSILSIIGTKDIPMKYGNYDYLCIKANKTVKFLGVGVQLSTTILSKVQRAEIEICLRDHMGNILSMTIAKIENTINPFLDNMVLKTMRYPLKKPVILPPNVRFNFSARMRILEGCLDMDLGCGVPNVTLGLPYSSSGIIFNLHELIPNYFITEIVYEKI